MRTDRIVIGLLVVSLAHNLIRSLRNDMPSNSSNAGLASGSAPPAYLRIAVVAIPFLVIVLGGIGRTLPPDANDGNAYYPMAEGRGSTVPKPWSGRILMPAIARAVRSAGRMSLDHAFLAVTLASLAVFLYANSAVALGLAWGRPWIVILVLTAPILVLYIQAPYLPDACYAALLAMSLWSMVRERWVWLMALIFAMQLTRESTMAFVLVFAVLLVSQSRRLLAASAVAACVVGMAVVAWQTRRGPPNIHSISTLSYLTLKVPFNGLKNLIGVVPWSDTLKGVNAHGPVWSVTLPGWIHLGAIRRIGVDEFDPVMPLRTWCLWLTAFGIGPAVLKATLNRRLFYQSPPWLKTALVYGLISFLIAPALGAGIDRLMSYGWPAFMLAAPCYLVASRILSRGAIVRLVALHVLLCWGDLALQFCWPARPALSHLIELAAVVLAQVCAYRLIRSLPMRQADVTPTAAPIG